MDAESGRIQAFLRRKLGLHDPESADSGASDTPLTPEGSGRAGRRRNTVSTGWSASAPWPTPAQTIIHSEVRCAALSQWRLNSLHRVQR